MGVRSDRAPFGARLLSAARRLVGNEDEARDVVQSAYLSAYRAIGQFEGSSQLSTWLHRIVVNTALMRLRTTPMTCRELADFIASYLDGTLPEETRAQLERHLAACANCVQYIAGYESTVTLGRLAFEDLDAPVPPSVPEELLRGILAARR